jgi:hypothetical protein
MGSSGGVKIPDGEQELGRTMNDPDADRMGARSARLAGANAATPRRRSMPRNDRR